MRLLKQLALPLLAISTLVSSCAIFQGKEHRAQNHLAKAISLDPNIIKSKDSIRIKNSVYLHDSTVVHYKDSVNIVTKDSTIIIPKSDLNGDIKSPCDSLKGLKSFDYSLGSGVHKLHIWSDGQSIRYSSTVDSLVSTIHSKDTYVQQLKDSLTATKEAATKEKETYKKEVVTVIHYKATFLQKLLFILIGLVLGAAIMWILKTFKVI